jgi:pimeloyl-ACP methyl ester carboxylesterase
MRKKVVWIIAFVTGVLIFAPAFSNYYFLQQVQKYPRETLEDSFQQDWKVREYQIDQRKDPGDFGYENWQEYTFKSGKDSLTLYGWFVNTGTVSSRCLILCHGRTTNRLSVLRYLQIIRENKLDSLFNIFIPDLRNSGKSDPALTAMGYHFAEDLAASMLHLNRNLDISEFSIYAFSMGAMASSLLMKRLDLQEMLEKKGIFIRWLILDSPLSNVPGTIAYEARKLHNVPEIFTRLSLFGFDWLIPGRLKDMRLGYLLRDIDIPVLIMQVKDDEQTPFYLFEKELPELSQQIEYHLFDIGGHVKIYNQPQYQQEYSEIVHNFILNSTKKDL